MIELNQNNFEIGIINNADNSSVHSNGGASISKSIRRKSRQIMVGNVPVGGGAPVSVQTMTKTKTSDAAATIAQIKRVEDIGADIVRVTVNNKEASEATEEIVKSVNLPIVADIHFNYAFALKAIESGVAKVRINPGNIGKVERIQKVLNAAKERGIPIRIGVNAGSLE